MGISRFEDSVPTVPLPLAEVRLVEAGLAPAAQCLCVCCAPSPGRCTPHASCKTEVTSAPINDMHACAPYRCMLPVRYSRWGHVPLSEGVSIVRGRVLGDGRS